MKTLKSILLLTVFTFLLGCSSDDDSIPVLELANETFAGNYSLTFLEETEVKTQIIDGGTIITNIKSVGDTFTNTIYAFNADGTFSGSGSYRITDTTTVTGNNPEEESYIVNVDDSGNYALNNTNRTITIDGDAYSVTRFTDTELWLQFSDTETIDGIEYVYNEDLRFTK